MRNRLELWRYLTATYLLRGKLCQADINEQILNILNTSPNYYTDWIHDNLYDSLCHTSNKGVTRSAAFLGNTTPGLSRSASDSRLRLGGVVKVFPVLKEKVFPDGEQGNIQYRSL